MRLITETYDGAVKSSSGNSGSRLDVSSDDTAQLLLTLACGSMFSSYCTISDVTHEILTRNGMTERDTQQGYDGLAKADKVQTVITRCWERGFPVVVEPRRRDGSENALLEKPLLRDGVTIIWKVVTILEIPLMVIMRLTRTHVRDGMDIVSSVVSITDWTAHSKTTVSVGTGTTEDTLFRAEDEHFATCQNLGKRTGLHIMQVMSSLVKLRVITCQALPTRLVQAVDRMVPHLLPMVMPFGRILKLLLWDSGWAGSRIEIQKKKVEKRTGRVLCKPSYRCFAIMVAVMFVKVVLTYSFCTHRVSDADGCKGLIVPSLHMDSHTRKADSMTVFVLRIHWKDLTLI